MLSWKEGTASPCPSLRPRVSNVKEETLRQHEQHAVAKVGHRPTQLHPSFNFSRGKKHETPSSLLLLQGVGAGGRAGGLGRDWDVGMGVGRELGPGRKEGRKEGRARVSE